MTRRELVRLPLGAHEVTNGIYNYTLEKSLSQKGEPIYSMKVKGDPWYADTIMFFEDTVQYEDEYFSRKTLRSLSGIKGFSVHSDYSDFIYSFWDLKLVPRGSFKEFITRTKI